jgi:hypothetical protein
MKTRTIVRIVMVCGFMLPFLLIFGCDDSTGPVSDILFPDTNVSYSLHVQPLFTQTCTFSGCHNDASRSGNLSLTNYQNATQPIGVIVAGDPDGSRLYQRIQGIGGPRMPLNRAPLNDNQINGIRTWIQEGALNN